MASATLELPVRRVMMPGVTVSGRGGAVVIVADADEDSRAIYAAGLRHAGFTVREAERGEEVVRLAHACRPGALVVSPVLRGVCGLRALEVLASDPATRAIPALVVSSIGDAETERRARAAGCAAYFVKPCPPSTIAATLHALTAVPLAA